jgi:ADP-dependent NAD(P)H-hydrate dehydratase / NAD(P)H-hydrate epimerase
MPNAHHRSRTTRPEPIVSMAQMQAIERRMFDAGMPVAALMEKVSGRITQRIQQHFPLAHFPRVGVVVGAGHNGGDALVVARELHWQGYDVLIYPISDPFTTPFKELTTQHYRYAISLGLTPVTLETLATCDVIVDGLFGFGLTRSLSTALITTIAEINNFQLPIVSIDLPSGIHADSGNPLGAAMQAQHTLCLGLWKSAFAQESALPYLGQAELVPFDIPIADIQAVIGTPSPIQMMTQESADRQLPHHRPIVTHKYQQGHLLLVVGSWQYAGAAILAGRGARASGVGLLSIAVPESIKLAVLQQLPDAIVIGCPETPQGAIAELPDLNRSTYSAIAVGCGLTSEPIAVIESLLDRDLPLILDADALNILANLPAQRWTQRSAATILTPHDGEWQRLFPSSDASSDGGPIDRLTDVIQTATQHQMILLRKGARTIVSEGLQTWVINNGTPALARGGSGDVLTGLIGGLVATEAAKTRVANTRSASHLSRSTLTHIVASASWWHAQAGTFAAEARGLAGVDAVTLSEYLVTVNSSR